MSDPERGKELLGVLRSVADAVSKTVREESPGILDRAAIVARFNLPFRLFIENPAYASLAKLAGARRLGRMAWTAAQMKWFDPGHHDALADRKLAADIEAALERVILATRDANAAEERWARLPENIADQAVSTFFAGLASTLERWANFLGRPFGFSWELIILGVAAVLVVVLVKKAG